MKEKQLSHIYIFDSHSSHDLNFTFKETQLKRAERAASATTREERKHDTKHNEM